MNEQDELELQEEEEVPQKTPEEGLNRLRAELEAMQRELSEGWSLLRQERRLDMISRELEKRGMAAGFAGFIMRDSDEESMAAVEQFEELFRESLTRAVTERMRGGLPPREPKRARGYRREELGGLSRREINTHWDEILRSLAE